MYMQAYGGGNGPTVVLCPNHHSLIHRLAKRYPDGIEASFKNNERERGTKLVSAIVRSMGGSDRVFKIVYKIGQDQRNRLGLLKEELGLGSLEATVDFSVLYLMKVRGIK